MPGGSTNWRVQSAEVKFEYGTRTALSSGGDPLKSRSNPIVAASKTLRTLTPTEIYQFTHPPKPPHVPWKTGIHPRHPDFIVRGNEPSPPVLPVKIVPADLEDPHRKMLRERRARREQELLAAGELRAEVDSLQKVLQTYESLPAPAATRAPAAHEEPSPRRPTLSSRQWARPVGLAAPTGLRSPRHAFSARERNPRVGSAGLSTLPSRFADGPPVHSMAAATAAGLPLPLQGDPATLAALAASAASAGVVPPFVNAPFVTLGMDGRPLDFTSPAVRFAVALAEGLDTADLRRTGAPSVDGCHVSLATLRAMVPLLGPLGPVLKTVHDTLELCMLSQQPSAVGLVATFEAAAAANAAAAEPNWPTATALTDGQWPANASCAAAAATCLSDTSAVPPPSAGWGSNTFQSATPQTASSITAAAAAAAAAAGSALPPPSGRGGGGIGRRGRSASIASERGLGRDAASRPDSASLAKTPYFLLVRELDEEQSALRQERDRALDEIARGSEDLTNLDEQLDTAREQLHSKSKTIDKLVREMNALEIELKGMRETARMAEHKYEVLQCEAVALQRASVSTTQRLEEEIQQLKLRIAEMLTPSDDV